MPELIQQYDVKYVGGHVEYPKSLNCKVYFFNDRIELENPDLVIPFRTLVNIENMDGKKITALRVVGLGVVFLPLAIVGALWKKKHIYTVIQYKDRSDEKIIILDFDDSVENIQKWIYRRMLSFRKSPTLTYAEKGFLIYENEKYGFRMKYPDMWIEDELNEITEEYVTVVEFRRFIDNKAPFVTLYVNNVDSKYKSSGDLVNKLIQDIKNDPSRAIVERSNVMIGGNLGTKLIDVDKKYSWDELVYKRMTVWIIGTGKVYEISYSNKEEQYEQYLLAVEQMLNSFQIIEGTMTVSDEDPHDLKSTDKQDPILTLKRRFARGEITEHEYEKMRRILET